MDNIKLKDTYIEDWNIVDKKYNDNKRPHELEIKGYKDQLVPDVGKVFKFTGLISLIGAIVAGGLGYINSAWYLWLSIPIGVLAIFLFTNYWLKNKEGWKVNRKLNKKISKLEDKIDKLYSKASDDKYNLSFEYAKAFLGDTEVSGRPASFSPKVIQFADIYERYKNSKGENKTRFVRTVMYSVGGENLPIYLSNNEYTQNIRGIDAFTIDEIVEENPIQTIAVLPNIKSKKLDVQIIANNIEDGALHIIEPSTSTKQRKWSKDLPELSGDYYPNVAGGDARELFKFFTPRRIDFFKNNNKANLVEVIKGNSLWVQSHNVSKVGYLEIHYGNWKDIRPDALLKELDKFLSSDALCGYTFKNHDFYTGELKELLK